jgi:protein gp37
MALNQKTKIDWTDYTWNPITGCKNTCDYCYARGIATRFAGSKGYPFGFEPTFHEHRLKEIKIVPPGSKVFVSSMGDPLGPWVERSWVEKTIEAMRTRPDVTFQMLTKFPMGYLDFDFPKNVWLGVTDEGDGRRLYEFAYEMTSVPKFGKNIRFVSFEPLMYGNAGDVLFNLKGDTIDWVIVGAMTGPKAPLHPTEEDWVKKILMVTEAYDVPVFLKNNLGWPEKIQQFPTGKERT